MKTLILKKNMKSRSNNRLQTSDPPDDWVNGSWTVDCKCGVTFDDGEEMVDCDECGVWVHTRCFRFAKGEKSFSCDKCKINNNNGSFRVNNDSEETEVAQLLVELPTKTIKMSTSNGNNYSYNYNYNYNYSRSSGSGSCYYNSSNYNGSGSNVFSVGNYPPPVPPPPKRPPNQLWMKPMEERVHVQGVPGGGDDDSLFKGFPIAFASELWKCSGYVPKKFNFRYREFPCWEDEVEGKVSGGVDDNVVDKGAGVLYSLSKENVVVSNSMSGGQARSGGSDRKGCKDRKLSNGNSKKLSMPSLSNKDKGMCRPIVIKRSREELGLSKDHSEKKKIKVSHREQDSKKDKGHDSKAVVIHSTSAKQADVYERKAHKVASNAHLTEGSNIEKPKRNAATDEGNLVLRSSEVAGPGCSSEKRVKVEKPRHDCVDSSQKSAKTETAPLLDAEKDGVGNDLKKKEGIVLDVVGNIQGPISECQTSDLLESKAVTEDVDVAAIENNSEAGKDVETTVLLAATTKSDSKGGMDGHVSDKIVELDSNGLKLFTEQVPSPGRECDDSKLNEANATSSNEDQDDGKILESLSSSQPMKDEGIVNIQCNNKLKCEGSENPTDVQRIFSDSKEVAKVAGEASKLIGETLPPSASQHKVTSARKSSLSSSTNVISKSSLSDKSKAESSQFLSSTGKRMSSNSSKVVKKESAVIVPDKDEDKYEKTKSMVKDHSKSSTNSMIKASQSSKSVTNPLLKRQTSLGKDSMKHPPSKKTSIESGLLSPGSDEPGGSRPTEQGSNGQNKNTSAGQHRGEKALQSSSKSTQFGHPPPSSSAPAGLSDEELALLLHQELNSSPRVPRIPRVRHTGSLPQLSSASATSIFVKRTTSSGGKEQQTFSRRKNKDGSRSSRDPDSEARKVDRAPSSPDSVKTSEALAQAEVPSESTQSVKKNAEYISTSTHSGPSSIDANELISSSTRGSPNNNPEDDTGTNNGLAPIHRTLPGLLAEIMGEGRRMTYEELCNAVLPHWQNLRKHNGERYAYSSHCQAVLDCLRNRSEWARLVDRGPKTSTIRKKHKIDVEPPISETEDGEDRTRRTGKSKSFDSNKEVFPKGRRKARKRRRLALRGRGVRDDGKRTKVEIRSEDSASVSNSSEDTGSSEDDSQESGMDASKSEVSASSAETTAACWS